MSIQKIDLINPCDRPNCLGIPLPEFVSYPGTASHLETIPVSCRILNNNLVPTATYVYYSMNDTNLNNSVISLADDGTYEPGDILFSTLPFQGVAGTLFIQARVVINGDIYVGDIESIIIIV